MKVVINTTPSVSWMSDQAIDRCVELGLTLSGQGRFRYLIGQGQNNSFRSDPRLIQAVEELGDKASGTFAKLKVIDIPFDTTEGWEIVEIYGRETVVDTNRMWN